MRISFVTGASADTPFVDQLECICRKALDQRSDAILLPEMPAGKWVCENKPFDAALARNWVAQHEKIEEALLETGCSFFFTRPVAYRGRLANQAMFLSESHRKVLHTKQIFPNEPGWFESDWFLPGTDQFRTMKLGGVTVAFLICTELFWPEMARSMFDEEIDVFLVPRATGGSEEKWLVAGRLLSHVTGSFVASSNRNHVVQSTDTGFLVRPDGSFETHSTPQLEPEVSTFTMDTKCVCDGRRSYPAYIKTPYRLVPCRNDT
ncbi:carbon-nitrogen hydrolase family protein [Yoonia sp. BS5-3]|uniref:Carbon-nitrogen hydrolase family protein n=1 Tax=Yoonia phaeophyticola TaxID=3137369 RepID=A0ABZ2V4J9_9RHOB